DGRTACSVDLGTQGAGGGRPRVLRQYDPKRGLGGVQVALLNVALGLADGVRATLFGLQLLESALRARVVRVEAQHSLVGRLRLLEAARLPRAIALVDQLRDCLRAPALQVEAVGEVRRVGGCGLLELGDAVLVPPGFDVREALIVQAIGRAATRHHRDRSETR